MNVIPATISPERATTRRLGELLGIPSSGGRARVAPTEAGRALPLVAVKVRARIVADCAVTELEERYANDSAQPMDVTHTIPLPAEGAVTAFELSSGGRVARGLCKRTEEAKADFASAARRGKVAALLDSVRDDVHVISLANVPPKSEIVVRMTIVERLRVDDGRFEYRFPTTISPKYVPGDAIGHEGTGTAPDTDRAEDASRLTPPVRLDGGTLLDLEIALPSDATDLSASIPLVRGAASEGLVVLRPESTSRCRQDVVVRAWSRGTEPVVRAYTDGDRTLVVVDPPARRRPELECPREAVFVLDRSGSMGGARIAAAKRALLAALRGLGERDTFEILAFDTSLEPFAAEPVAANPTNLDRASRWLDGIDARGGTDAMPALERACARHVAPGRVRTVLFITDGDVGNDRELLGLVRRFDPAVRLFTIGIGLGPSAGLLGRLARIGGGSNLSVSDSDDVESEIRRFEAALAGPMACGIGSAHARRHSGRDLFAGRSTTFFIDGAPPSVEVASIDGRFSASARVAPSPIALGALWARDRVTELEDRLVAEPSQRGLIDPEIADLGVRYQIQTRLTSFVAVDEASQVHGEPIAVVQPTDVPADASAQALACRLAPMGSAPMGCAPTYPSPSASASPMRDEYAEFVLHARAQAHEQMRASRLSSSIDAVRVRSSRKRNDAAARFVDEFMQSGEPDLRLVVLLLLATFVAPALCTDEAKDRALARLDELADAASAVGSVELAIALRKFRDAVRATKYRSALRHARELIGEAEVAALQG